MPGNTWEDWEIARLRALLAQGFSASEMVIGDRTPAAIQNKASRLQFVGDGIPRRPWSRGDEQQLRRLVREGMTAASMATELRVLAGYSRNAIQKKIGRMQLADSRRSLRARHAVRLTISQLERFQVFLLAHAARCTPEQIALMWSRDQVPPVSRRRVVYHLQKLGIKRSWAEVMRMPFSKAKQRQVSAKAAASRASRWKQYRAEQDKQLRELARRRRQASRTRKKKSLPERVCRDCRGRWPGEDPFYVIYRKTTAAGRQRYVGRICRACRNRRRRDSNNRRKLVSTHSTSPAD